MHIALRLSIRMSCRFLWFLVSACSILRTRSQVHIEEPAELASYIQGSTAAFGTPLYGDHIFGRLYYGVPKNDSMPHCDAGYSLVPASDTIDSTDAPISRIVLVQRGGCPFAQKVRVAEEVFKANAAIVVDDEPARTAAEVRLVIMAEDEGQKIHEPRHVSIPSVLISHEEGNRLINAILLNVTVFARLEWDVPNAPVVEMDQWVSPALTASVKFLQKFAHFARRFNAHLDFRPHYWIFQLPNDYDAMCTDSTGKFCSIEAQWGDSKTGKSVVEESVRQYCLWRESKVVGANGFPAAFWDYAEKHPMSCTDMGQECSFALMSDVGAPISEIRLCYETEFDQICSVQKDTVAWGQTATMINSWRYAGPLAPTNIASAICTGFFEEPEVCSELEAKSSSAPQTAVPVGWWVYLLTVLAIIVGMLMVVACYRGYLYRRLRNELRYEVFEEVKSRTQPQNNENLIDGTRNATQSSDKVANSKS